MNWVLAVVVCILLVETALRLPFGASAAGVARAGAKAIRVVRAKAISDHWKEKALAAYAKATFLSSLRLAVLLAVFLAIAAVLVLVFDRISGGFQDFILGWLGIGFTIVFASLYYTLRKRLPP